MIGRIIFLTLLKNMFRDSDWTYEIFTFENTVRFSDWLVLICVQYIYDMAFQSVYLSNYMMKTEDKVAPLKCTTRAYVLFCKINCFPNHKETVPFP